MHAVVTVYMCLGYTMLAAKPDRGGVSIPSEQVIVIRLFSARVLDF